MNILFITPLYPEYSGQSIKETSYALHDIVKLWKDHGNCNIRVIKPVFLARKKKLHYHRIETIDGIEVHSVGCLKVPKTESWFHFGPIKRLVAKWGSQGFTPQIKVAHMLGGLLAAKSILPRVPMVFGVHNSDIKEHRRILELRTSIRGIAYRSPSIKGRFPWDPNTPQITAISGIDSRIVLDRDLYVKIGIQAPTRFLYAGILEKGKKIDSTLKALSQLEEIPWQFDIIGDGEERKALTDLTNSLGISDKVRFHGYQPREYCLEWMEKSDIFIMVSAPETLGLVYLEALAKSCIIIGAKGWGIDGILSDRREAFLVQPDNIDELKETIVEVLKSDIFKLKSAMYDRIENLNNLRCSMSYLEFIKGVLHEQNR